MKKKVYSTQNEEEEEKKNETNNKYHDQYNVTAKRTHERVFHFGIDIKQKKAQACTVE